MQISRETALATCQEVRRDNRHRYFSAGHWQCWGCMRFGGEPEGRCMRTDAGWDGCSLINRKLVRSM